MNNTTKIQQDIQERCEAGYWGSRVTKRPWPKGDALSITGGTLPDLIGVGVVVHSFHMKQCAVNSPYVTSDNNPYIARYLGETAKQVWEKTFQRELINNIATHQVRQGYSDSKEPLPRRVNFRGKEVSPYVMRGERKVNNSKYQRAATQEIYFDPETVEFLFPDPSAWAGEVVYREIPGSPPFYRAIFKYAARPLRPELGLVVTVLPPGLKGFLWRWAWKLVGFVP